jgi:hypothetical protein
MVTLEQIVKWRAWWNCGDSRHFGVVLDALEEATNLIAGLEFEHADTRKLLGNALDACRKERDDAEAKAARKIDTLAKIIIAFNKPDDRCPHCGELYTDAGGGHRPKCLFAEAIEIAKTVVTS